MVAPLAKTIRCAAPALLAGFRHELASVRCANGATDLTLHLVASHHGWARPCWRDKAYDRDCLRESEQAAFDATRRFAHLQRDFGAWGLAYLEAVFKAADAIVSERQGTEKKDA
jgi:CRISPR-associated endonuclease/helicase Cas3